MRENFQKRLQPVRGRLQQQLRLRGVAGFLLVGGAVSLALSVLRLATQGAFPMAWAAAALIVAAVVGVAMAMRKTVSWEDAARAADRSHRCGEAVVTAWELSGRSGPTPMQQLQMQQAAPLFEKIEPKRAAPGDGFSPLLKPALCVLAAAGMLFAPHQWEENPDAEIRRLVEQNAASSDLQPPAAKTLSEEQLAERLEAASKTPQARLARLADRAIVNNYFQADRSETGENASN